MGWGGESEHRVGVAVVPDEEQVGLAVGLTPALRQLGLFTDPEADHLFGLPDPITTEGILDGY